MAQRCSGATLQRGPLLRPPQLVRAESLCLRNLSFRQKRSGRGVRRYCEPPGSCLPPDLMGTGRHPRPWLQCCWGVMSGQHLPPPCVSGGRGASASSCPAGGQSLAPSGRGLLCAPGHGTASRSHNPPRSEERSKEAHAAPAPRTPSAPAAHATGSIWVWFSTRGPGLWGVATPRRGEKCRPQAPAQTPPQKLRGGPAPAFQQARPRAPGEGPVWRLGPPSG